MNNEIPQSRLDMKTVLVLAGASAATYAAVHAFGLVAIGTIAGLTIGYVFARCTNY